MKTEAYQESAFYRITLPYSEVSLEELLERQFGITNATIQFRYLDGNVSHYKIYTEHTEYYLRIDRVNNWVEFFEKE